MESSSLPRRTVRAPRSDQEHAAHETQRKAPSKVHHVLTLLLVGGDGEQLMMRSVAVGCALLEPRLGVRDGSAPIRRDDRRVGLGWVKQPSALRWRLYSSARR